MYKKAVLVLLLVSVVLISGCAQSSDTGTTQKEIKAKKKLTIESYCKSTGEPPPCEANDTVVTPTPSETSTPTGTTSLPPILPSSTATPTTSPPTLPTSSATPTGTTSLPPILPSSTATPTTSPPTSLPSSSASPSASVSPTSTVSPTPTTSIKEFGCCVVCEVNEQGYSFFPSGSYTMTEAKCESYNQNTDDYYAGDYLWGKDTDICPIKGPPVQEYEIGSEIDNIDVFKFCAAFGRVPPQ